MQRQEEVSLRNCEGGEGGKLQNVLINDSLWGASFFACKVANSLFDKESKTQQKHIGGF